MTEGEKLVWAAAYVAALERGREKYSIINEELLVINGAKVASATVAKLRRFSSAVYKICKNSDNPAAVSDLREILEDVTSVQYECQECESIVICYPEEAENLSGLCGTCAQKEWDRHGV